MAKLYLRGKTYWGTFSRNGKQVRFSTGQTERQEAMRVLYETIAPTMMRTQADRIESVAAQAGALRNEAAALEAARLPLKKGFAFYPTSISIGHPKKESTIRNARSAWNCFLKFAAERNIRHFGAVTEKLAADFLEASSPRWRQICYQVCRAIFAGAKAPCPFKERPTHPESEVQHRMPLTPVQIRQLLAEADSRKNHPQWGDTAGEYATLIRFILYTGLRLGDAATTRQSQIDWQAMTLSRIMGKTGRRVTFPLHPSIAAILPRTGDYLFPRLAASYEKRQGILSQHIRHLFADAGITGPSQAYCAHALRTTFASLCAQALVPIAVIQSWLGHTSQEVTRIYARVEDMEAKRKALAKLPELG